MKHLDLFSGYGGFSIAAEVHGLETIGFSEIDKSAISVLKYHYNSVPNYNDITKVDPNSLPDFDFLTFGAPCFPRGQFIISEHGYTQIEDIKTGDSVLTHTGSWKQVTTCMSKTYTGNLYTLNLKYYRLPIVATEDHPFFTLRGWVPIKDLIMNDFIGFPINVKKEIPIQSTYIKNITGRKAILVETSLPFGIESFWKLIGYWLAEGWTRDTRCRKGTIRPNYQVILSAPYGKKLEYITEVLKELSIKFNLTAERTSNKLRISNQELWMFIKKFTTGTTAKYKYLPEFVQDLPINLGMALVDGYFTGDGHTYKNKYNGGISFGSISLKLLMGLQRLLLKTNKRLFSLELSIPERECIIEERTCHSNTYYTLSGGATQGGKVIFKDNYVYIGIASINKELKRQVIVYNMAVDIDNSYCLPLAAVHNCQGYSIAGKRKGIEDTRSQVIFNVFEILKIKQPKYFIFENVIGLLSIEKGEVFKDILKHFCECGYAVDFEVLNAKDFGVPQNRQRVFVVGVRIDLIDEAEVF